MKSARSAIIYIASGFVVAGILSAAYFFFRKPERIAPPALEESKTAIIFTDVKYSGEKRGTVDWEIRAKTGRKYIDKPLVEMENMDGEYKPKPGILVRFKGSRGFMNTEEETGSVENVTIIHNDEYTLTTKYLDFDFQNGTIVTRAPVTIRGRQISLMGEGLLANTKDETIQIKKNVNGFVESKKGRYRFVADTFTYSMKENRYVLDGNAMMSGEDMRLTCARMYVYTDGDEIVRVEAHGKVRMEAKGSVAKSEQAVYHFKDAPTPSREPSKTGSEILGLTKKGKSEKKGKEIVEQQRAKQKRQ